MQRSLLTSVVGGIVLIGLLVWMLGDGEPKDVRIEVFVPELSETALQGQRIFNDKCADCHGVNASGSAKGPPLIDLKYSQRQHADGAVNIAIMSGVRQHHWKFGSMQPLPAFDTAGIPAIITFIREVQRANGID